MSGYYAQQNAGKRNVSIDLNVPGARALALRLCDTADVVVENFRAGTLGFFGLDYETLAARNPRLIYASITGYGQGGPWQGRMAYAPTVQAEAGFTANSMRHYGEALGEPRTDSLSHADVYAGLQAAIAILAALHRRETTGKGQYIDISMAATLMAVNERAHVDLNDSDLGAEPAILGATDCPFFTGPGGEHFTVATSLIGSRTFPSYLRAMRRADLAEDPRFATAAARRANLEELHRIVQCWILTFHDIGALDAQLDEAKIALGEVRSLKKLSEMEWAEYWGAIQEVSDRNGGTYRLPGRPWHFSHEKLEPLGSPAFQGEHNRAVFSELGLSEDEIGLRRGGRASQRIYPRNGLRLWPPRERHREYQATAIAHNPVLNRSRPPGLWKVESPGQGRPLSGRQKPARASRRTPWPPLDDPRCGSPAPC